MANVKNYSLFTEFDINLFKAGKLFRAYQFLGSHIIEVDELPKNSSGKLDIGSLPEPSWASSGSDKKEKPANEVEAALLTIFEKVLKISPIGTNENFLKIGANSLGLFVAFSEVEKKFNVKIDVKTTIENPSIQSLASMISQKWYDEKPITDQEKYKKDHRVL